MTVVPKWYYSGGATNADPSLSIGGAKSSVALSTVQLNNLFDNTTGAEATAGADEYRLLYCQNDGTTAWVAPVMYITAQPAVSGVATGETLKFGMNAVRATIATSSVAAATVITTTAPHGLANGASVVIAGHSGSTPAVDGTYVATVTGPNTFTIPLNVSTGGTGGTVTGAAAKNTAATAIANVNTAPDYVIFGNPATLATGTALPTPDYAGSDYVGVWFHKHTPASQAIKVGSVCSWEVTGDNA